MLRHDVGSVPPPCLPKVNFDVAVRDEVMTLATVCRNYKVEVICIRVQTIDPSMNYDR